MQNRAIAAMFNDIADMLEIKDDSPFRITAPRHHHADGRARDWPEDRLTAPRKARDRHHRATGAGGQGGPGPEAPPDGREDGGENHSRHRAHPANEGTPT